MDSSSSLEESVVRLLPSTQEEEEEQQQTDAGALFVFESKGTWVHAGYHLTSATAGPPLLTLPYAMSLLGWGPGLFILTMGAVVSFYSYYLLSLVLEQMDKKGKRALRFRELVHHLLDPGYWFTYEELEEMLGDSELLVPFHSGPKWSYHIFAPLQLTICFMTVVVCILLGGQSMKAIYSATYTDGHLMLYEFIVIFGVFTLTVSQFPSFHSLRHLNMISMLLCLGFTLCAIIGSILAGTSENAPPKNYKVLGTPTERMLGVFNSISMMASAYGNTVIVEIQATLKPPVGRKLVKGLTMCYVVTLLTFFSVAIAGYWAFGNAAQGVIFSNMYSPTGLQFVPTSLIIAANAFIFLQLVLAAVLYSQPSFEILEGMLADAGKARFSRRNLVPRLVGRSLFVTLAAFLAAMLPFFADISSVMGALGFTPLCIILPIVLYTKVFNSSEDKEKVKQITWLNHNIIIVVAILVAIMGTIASLRQVVLDAKTYRLFADL